MEKFNSTITVKEQSRSVTENGGETWFGAHHCMIELKTN